MNELAGKFIMNQMAMKTKSAVTPVVYSPSINRNLSGITLIEGVLTAEQILNLYQEGMDGRYSATTEEYGEEIFIISYYKGYFKRITGEQDYVLNTTTLEWEVISGSSGANSVTLISNVPLSINTPAGEKTSIKFFYKSSLDIAGTAKLIVGTSVKETFIVSSGRNVEKDITKYIVQGASTTVILEVTDSNSTKKLVYIVTSVQLNLTSTFNDKTFYTTGSKLTIPYTIVGPGQKKVIFTLDNVEKEITTSINGGTNNFTDFTVENHGEHILTIQAHKDLETTTIYSEEIRFSIICIDSANSIPIISSRFMDGQTVELGTPILIDYAVYDPLNTRPSLTIYLNDNILTTVITERGKRSTYSLYDYTPQDGKIKIKLKTGDVFKEYTVNINIPDLTINHVDGYVLQLTANGKSNDEDESTRSKWYYNGQAIGTLSNFSWGSDNGWGIDEDNIPVLHVNGDSKVDINFYPFASQNFDVNSGMTIEVDFKTKNVIDFTKTLIESFGDGKGFKILGNECTIKSLLSTPENNIKYKEQERIKVSFVIGNINENLIRIYVNGVLSGLTSYLTDPTDTFLQGDDYKSSIKINNDGGGNIDIYSITIYKNPLTHREIVNNYIADMALNKQLDFYEKNNIYAPTGEETNAILYGGEVSYDKVKELIPTMLFTKGTSDKVLPTHKDDKTYINISFYHPFDESLNFELLAASLKWQGTSSLGYVRKNYKFELQGTTYSLYKNAVPEKLFTIKADYMESSHSHNTGCANLINEISPDFDHAEQVGDVRNAIYGYPIALFVQQEENELIEFYGIYNFNNDKEANDTLGLVGASQSWEVEDNLNALCLFNPSKDENGNYDFTNLSAAFSNIYPDTPEYTKLKELIKWVADTEDIEKFKEEFTDYFNLDFCLFYHNMVYVLAAGDSLAKNMRLEYLPFKEGETRVYKWAPRWYDIDSVLGLENKGHLIFGPYVEMDSTYGTNNTPVFNGKESLLWKKFEEAFKEEIAENYRKLRDAPVNALSYALFETYLKENQIDKIALTLYNEDGTFKYITPGKEEWYFVAQGTRLSHLQWWLDQRIKYLDSKYEHGAYEEDYLLLTLNQPEGATVTPSPNITLTAIEPKYLSVDYDGSITLKEKFEKGETKEFTPELANYTNAATRVYGVSSISDFGDLSTLYLSNFGFYSVSKIKKLTLGNSTTGYTNDGLTTLSLGEYCPLLEELNIRNCTGLTGPLDLTKCLSLKTLDARGTKLSSIQLSDGGYVQSVQLPASISSLTITNQANLNNLTLEEYENLTVLTVKNSPKINVMTIIQLSSNLSSVEVNNIDWIITSNHIEMMERLRKLSAKLSAKLSGKITVSSSVNPIPSQIVELWSEAFPDVLFEGAVDEPGHKVTYFNEDGVAVYTTYTYHGGPATYNGSLMTKEPDEYTYEFMRWVPATDNVTEDIDVYPVFFSNKPTTFEIDVKNLDALPYIKLSYFTANKILIDWGDNTTTTYAQYGSIYRKENPYSVTGIYEVKVYIYTYSNWYEHASIELSYESSGAFSILSWDAQDGIYGKITRDTFGVSYYSPLNTLNIPQGVTIVESGAGSSGLKNISIPMSLESLPESILQASLNYISVSPLNKYYMEQDGMLYNKDQTILYRSTVSKNNVVIPNSVTSIGIYAFRDCTALTSITIPNSVTMISQEAFRRCTALTNITIPDSVTSISIRAFYDCTALTNITISNSVTMIRQETFYGCDSLTSITIPDSVTSIGDSAFRGCDSLTSITIPNSVTSIGRYAFYSCDNLSSIIIPDSVTSIEAATFYWCHSLTSITIPDRVTHIEQEAFYGCDSLTSIILPASIEYIGESCFSETELTKIYYKGTIENWCNIDFQDTHANPNFYRTDSEFYMLNSNNEYYMVKEIEIPDTVTTIKADQFAGMHIESIYIPETVVEIQDSAFFLCNNLGSITFKDIQLTRVGSVAFYSCTSLTNVYLITSNINEAIANWCKIEFESVLSNPMSHASHLYYKSLGDEEFTELLSLDSDKLKGIEEINNYQFYGFKNLQRVDIPENITAIKTAAFSHCSNLATVNIGTIEGTTINSSLTTIGEQAFNSCDSLTTLILPATVSTVGTKALWTDGNLTIYYEDGIDMTSYNENWYNAEKTTLQLWEPEV